MTTNLQTKFASEMLSAQTEPEEKPKRRHYRVTDRETRGAHLREHQWQKGQSGNPKGRPVKNLSLVSLLKEHLDLHPEDAHAIVLALVNLGKGKDMRAIEELLNRVDGKVAETHRIETEKPIQILFVPASELLKEELVPSVEEGLKS